MTFETDMEEQLERMKSLIHLQRTGQMGVIDFIVTYREYILELQAIYEKHIMQINTGIKP